MKKLSLLLLVLLLTLSFTVSCTVTDNGTNEDVPPDAPQYAYTAFTPAEKALFTEVIGETIPFLANNEYYVETDSDEAGPYVNFYTYGNTEAEFEAYRASLTGYTLADTHTGEGGATVYSYEKGSICLDISYRPTDDGYITDVFVYIWDEGGDDNTNPSGKLYTDFTADEKDLLNSLFGTVIPFIPNDEYYVELLNDQYGSYINFYTYGNTEAEFNAYRNSLTGYTFDQSYVDDYGDTVYCYVNGDICLDISYYLYEGEYVVDAYIYLWTDDNGGENTGTDTPVDPTGKTYTDFTSTEKSQIISMIGELIPFLPNNEYYVDELEDEYGNYINFYTYGNTQAEFNAYRASLTGYTLASTEVDDYGDTWYYYEKGDICIDIAYYETEDGYVADIYIYLWTDDNGGDNTGDDNTGTDTPVDPSGKTYTDFTSTEKSQIISMIGELIPFLPNNEYYVDELEDEYGNYINFYTYGNTQAEFNAYRASLTGYTLASTEVDDYGDTWYYYEKGDICIDIAYYETEDGYVADIYIYLWTEDDGVGGEGGSGNGSTAPSDVDLITNNGKGLPTDEDGVYDVDFTKGENVKDVTDQGFYLDGCPTVGSPAVLVIPVDFLDVTAASKGYDLAKLQSAFASNNPSDGFYSVYEYYYISSYGQLTVDFTVLDSWFRPQYDSEYYANSTDSDGYLNGDQLVIDEALAYLSTFMDLSRFDSDGNGYIDAIVIVHTLDIDDSTDFYWAYRYWNYHVDGDGYYYEYDGVSANDYLWASFDFLHESYDEDGNISYDDNTVMNTYTFIHEFGHVLGADDYYDYTGINSPLNGADVMDGMLGDHNAFTKFNYGWLTDSRLVVCEGSITLTLEAFAKNGDTVIIANNWDDTLGAYQEYYIIVYYTAEGLNAGEDYGYFQRDGIVVYHVNASLYREVYDGETYYDIYFNNTDQSDEYGTTENLIEFVLSAEGTYTYVEGDTMADTYDDAGNLLAYNFVVDSIDGDTATITFTKR